VNLRLGLQYTIYDKFNGASTNFDGSGRNAYNNNTFFACPVSISPFVWLKPYTKPLQPRFKS
jgi:hypothetical protein